MTDRKKPNIPFINLHTHDTYSTMDGFGFPSQHLESVYSNGMNALATTNHGNMNSAAHIFLHSKKMQKEGRDIKPIWGVEAYVIPSIESWKQDYEDEKKKSKKERNEKVEDDGGLVIENEQETKTYDVKRKLNQRFHMVLLAQNEKGLKNIYKLISDSYVGDNFYRFPRMDYKSLKKHSEGVIGLQACLGSNLAKDYFINRDIGPEAVRKAMIKTNEQMLDIFGDRWYGELQWNAIPEQHEVNKYVISVCKEMNIPLVSTADAHYPTKDDWKFREIYKKLGFLGSKNENFTIPKSIDEMPYELYPKNGDEMWESYKRYSKQLGHEYDDKEVLKSIENAYHIGNDRIERFYPNTDIKLPKFALETDDPNKELKDKAFKALEERKLSSNQEYVKRLEKELSVISKLNFSSYFLTTAKITEEANKIMLTSPSRGSAGGSLISYLLGITQLNPIPYKLQFERFLTSESTTFPDIDLDFSNNDKLKKHLIEKWGQDSVVSVSNYNTLQPKTLVKEISRLLEIPFEESNAVTTKMIAEATPPAKLRHNIKAGVYVVTLDEIKEFSPTFQKYVQKYPEVETYLDGLKGMISAIGRHAGGVILSDNISENMPLISSKGVVQTPWVEGQTARHLEFCGFLKFDLLGLDTLEMFEICIKHILKRHHNIANPTFEDVKKYYDEKLHPDKIDLNDQVVWKKVFKEGNYPGIFQLSQPGAQAFCKSVQPDCIQDLSAMTSIFRPGALSSHVDKQYLDWKKDKESVKYMHPILKDILKETGFLIYQEQLSEIAHRMGKNISLEEGQMLRKVLTKKGTGKEVEVKEKLWIKFKEGCLEKGLKENQISELWEMMVYFSGYAFNMSHAVGYSITSFQCGYLFTYYPQEWLVSYLDITKPENKEKAISVCKSLGYNIQKLDINISNEQWEIASDNKTLVQPLTSIKNVGEGPIKDIISHRPYKTIEDFLFHPEMNYSKLNKKNIDALCRSGALDCLIDKRFTGAKHFWSAVCVDRPRTKEKLNENISLYAPEGDFSQDEKISNLTDLTGVYPLNLIVSEKTLKYLEDKFIPPLGEFDQELGLCWFIIKGFEQKKTQKGKDYVVLDCIDSTNIVTKIKCWTFNPTKDKIHMHKPMIGKIDYSEQWGMSIRGLNNLKLIG